MSVVCLDNVGLEDKFDLGAEYVVLPSKDKSMLVVRDRNGVGRECFAERFKQVTKPSRKPAGKLRESWTETVWPGDRSCTCHLGHPPCSFCVEGGYCEEHDCMRNDCGCEP